MTTQRVLAEIVAPSLRWSRQITNPPAAIEAVEGGAAVAAQLSEPFGPGGIVWSALRSRWRP